MASVITATALSSTAADTSTNTPATALADLSVEQLMNESVTSVAKRKTKLNESPAAVAVITQEDIRRLGITSIPDALRLVPGVDVAQINSHEWSVSVRGFVNEFANKLLVLVDGRSIYDNGFGGVLWYAQDLPIEDIDRIEVIRGPGASLWGANAVNGVINIITKSAKDTQGALVSVEGGTLDQPSTTIRYGGTLATNLYYRAYAKVLNSDGLVTSGGQSAPDRTLEARAGGRIDWDPTDADKFTLQGDFYRARLVENLDDYSIAAPYYRNYNAVDYDAGGNILGRWAHDFSDTQSISLQTYYDRFTDEQAEAIGKQTTFDIDVQHRFALGGRNEITWGLGYRDTTTDYSPSDFVSWSSTTAHDHLYSCFLQDEISIIRNRLKLTLGSKLEHNDYTGFEVEPSGRLLWTPTERQSVWAAISRAIRTPSWSEMHADTTLGVVPASQSPSGQELVFKSMGNPDLESESLIAYELGYRIEASKHVSFDIAAYYNQYDGVLDYGPLAYSPNPSQPYSQFSTTEENMTTGDTFGAEFSAHWDVTDHWHLTANYAWLNMRFPSHSIAYHSGPEHQAQLRSTLDLPCNLELNGAASFVDRVDASTLTGEVDIPSYVRLDVGLVWHATKNLELGVWGQNLAEDHHAEYTSYKTALITEIPRSVMGRITWHF